MMRADTSMAPPAWGTRNVGRASIPGVSPRSEMSPQGFEHVHRHSHAGPFLSLMPSGVA